jgi:hypothetical protein
MPTDTKTPAFDTAGIRLKANAKAAARISWVLIPIHLD